MSAGSLWRPAVALLAGAALPHAVNALWAARVLPGPSPGLQHALAWIVVGLPAAWLVARIAGGQVRACAFAAAAGGLLALAAPFAVYGLPVVAGSFRLLAVHIGVLGFGWPATILWLARRA